MYTTSVNFLIVPLYLHVPKRVRTPYMLNEIYIYMYIYIYIYMKIQPMIQFLTNSRFQHNPPAPH